ncbi:MAG: hypothetical protein JKY71_09420 [Alphaproteobacteria bacterium]|nr:hypothetical protein [Alphaproteobacteria bacterium]
MVLRSAYALSLCLLGFSLIPTSAMAQQESAAELDAYAARGGFHVYEFNDTRNYSSVLEELYETKGHLFKSDVTVYTRSHAFTGSIIQVSGSYVVMLDKTRTGPRETDVKAVHIIDIEDITGVTAYTLK